MAKSRADQSVEFAAKDLRVLVGDVTKLQRTFVSVMLDPASIVATTRTGRLGSDGSRRAYRNFEALKVFHQRAVDLHHAPGVTDRVRHGLVMAAAELDAKRWRSPQDNVQSSKLLRAIDDLWHSMRAAEDRTLIGQVRALAQDLCAFSGWPRTDWPGLA